MDVRVEVKDSSYREGGWHAVKMSNQRRRRCRRRDDAVGCLDVLLPEHTQEAPLTAHVEHV